MAISFFRMGAHSGAVDDVSDLSMFARTDSDVTVWCQDSFSVPVASWLMIQHTVPSRLRVRP